MKPRILVLTWPPSWNPLVHVETGLSEKKLVCTFVSLHLCLAHHALKIARAYTQTISVQRMTCAVCLEYDATFACECTAYHTTCLSHVLMRDAPWTHDCRICHSEYDRKLLANALEIAFQNSVDVFGRTSGTTKIRQLELASALAKVSQNTRARDLLIDVLVNPKRRLRGKTLPENC